MNSVLIDKSTEKQPPTTTTTTTATATATTTTSTSNVLSAGDQIQQLKTHANNMLSDGHLFLSEEGARSAAG